MTLMQSMIGFDGRVSRKTFWLAMLVQFAAMLLIFLPLLHWMSGGQWLGDDWGKSLRTTQIETLALIISFVAILYPSLTVSARRLHDLDYSAQWSWALYLPGVASLLVSVFGFGGFSGAATLLDRILDWPVFIAAAVYLVGLGCLRGTDGANRFGPDPLGAQVTPGQPAPSA